MSQNCLCPESGRQKWMKQGEGCGQELMLHSVTQNACAAPSSKTIAWLVGEAGVHAGEDFRLVEGDNIVGSGWIANIVLTTPYVSRTHASIHCSLNSSRIVDTGSASGVFVNGEKVSERELRCGDVVKIGSADFRFWTAESPKGDDKKKNGVISVQDLPENQNFEQKVCGWLLCVQGKNVGGDFRLVLGKNRIGKAADLEVSIPHQGAENISWTLAYARGAFDLRRLPGAQPVLLNRKPVDHAVVKDGDVLSFAEWEFVLRAFDHV